MGSGKPSSCCVSASLTWSVLLEIYEPICVGITVLKFRNCLNNGVVTLVCNAFDNGHYFSVASCISLRCCVDTDVVVLAVSWALEFCYSAESFSPLEERINFWFDNDRILNMATLMRSDTLPISFSPFLLAPIVLNMAMLMYLCLLNWKQKTETEDANAPIIWITCEQHSGFIHVHNTIIDECPRLL